MPDLMVITCFTCPSNLHWHKKVKGSSGEYDVSYSSHDGWHCTCPQFKFRKVDCKHIKQAETERCGWNWEAFCGTRGNPVDGKCPNCGEPVEPVRVGV